MTEQAATAETKHASLSDIFSGKDITKSETVVTEAKPETKAEEQQPTPQESVENPEVTKLREELEKERKRREDNQKWGNSQRQATLKIIKNLQEKGVSEDEIAEAVGGQEIFTAVMKGLPVDQELSNPMSVVDKAFNDQITYAASVMKEMGHSEDELKEFMAAFNEIAYSDPEHREELYRRATSGEGSVAAYALKVGKEKLEEYRTAQNIKTKGVKNFEQELRERIRKEVEEELQSKAVKDELVTSGKPRIGSGQPSTQTKEEPIGKYPSIKDVFGR